MPASVETTGKTIDQALEKALKELAARKDQVDIEVLSESQGGIMGLFGGKMVKIRVTRRDGPNEVNNETSDIIRGIIAEVLGFMGVEYTLTIEASDDTTFVNISSDGLDGLLIGRRGETLSSIQHIVNRVFTGRTQRHSKITVDVGGYVHRQHRLLIEKAHRLADRVRRTQREGEFELLELHQDRPAAAALRQCHDIQRACRRIHLHRLIDRRRKHRGGQHQREECPGDRTGANRDPMPVFERTVPHRAP
jgi:spoIIIJ-associated protein